MFKEVPANNHSLATRKPIHNIGINDAPYHTTVKINGKQVRCPFYKVWSSMINRCYDPKYQSRRQTYIDCLVCSDWLYFMNFREWMLKQDWKNKALDKDLLEPNNTIYCPETCCFVSLSLNNLILTGKGKRGNYPIGVSWAKHAKKFSAMCSVDGKSVFIGYFDTEEEASLAYNKFKFNHVQSIAKQQNNIDISYGLLCHAENLFLQVI